MIEKEEGKQLTRKERIHGLTVVIAIIAAILMLGAAFAIVIRSMIS